jgi:hypothetical protein
MNLIEKAFHGLVYHTQGVKVSKKARFLAVFDEKEGSFDCEGRFGGFRGLR